VGVCFELGEVGFFRKIREDISPICARDFVAVMSIRWLTRTPKETRDILQLRWQEGRSHMCFLVRLYEFLLQMKQLLDCEAFLHFEPSSQDLQN
jgi:hypothetical protein